MERLVKIVHVKVIWIDREIKSNYETENVCKFERNIGKSYINFELFEK